MGNGSAHRSRTPSNLSIIRCEMGIDETRYATHFRKVTGWTDLSPSA
jgi:hypothetical protein